MVVAPEQFQVKLNYISIYQIFEILFIICVKKKFN